MVFYRVYKYSILATLMSALVFLCGAGFLLAGAGMLFGVNKSIFAGIILLIIGLLFAYEFFAHKLTDKVADRLGRKNIESKARYGLMYCREHPEEYEYVRSVNKAFAEKYVMQENGEIVKIKKQ